MVLPFTGHLPWVILLIVVLVIFGPKRLPELGGAVGKALREFRQATSEFKEQVSESVSPQAGGQAPAAVAGAETAEKPKPQPETPA